jgi:glutathione peroxidase
VSNTQIQKTSVTIVVNVASKCGYTESHYRGLVNLWSKVKDESVEILAFPCNQFGSQEPDSDAQILQFAKGKGVEFTMMSKIDVNGPTASPVYKYLKKAAGPGAISWNFGMSCLVIFEFAVFPL